MKVHFIAIGGSAMHNLAIALHKKGAMVSGSDDEIFDPSRSRLLHYGLLPETTGWDPDRIHSGLDAVIVGMHARADNPELRKARSMGLDVFSYPEFLFRQSAKKTRVVIGGSHGKTTITSMILHVLIHHRIDTDYMVGAQLEGFEVMVKLSDKAPFMIMEGDEYPSSPIDPRPKFHLYKPSVGLISGIAWDHINVFKTFDQYLDQFKKFIDCIEDHGTLIYNATDPEVRKICERHTGKSLQLLPYHMPRYEIKNGVSYVMPPGLDPVPVRLFGQHNMLNMEAARLVCNQLGVSDEMFMHAIKHFSGASRRMETLYDDNGCLVIRDFAHAPSKVSATVRAVKEQFPEKKLIACLELHTYSSLSMEFLLHYRGSLDAADHAIVFFSPHALSLKRLPPLTPVSVEGAFNKEGLEVITDPLLLESAISGMIQENCCLLMMSSGSFGGLDMNQVIGHIQSHANRK
ncbi:MAG: UDP-N-acetylmuramate--L-alanine ligase [Bacteroidales bacterium]